jgi:uncharacterized linocin/CFP29 family protein
MSSIFRQDKSPLTDEAWKSLEQTVRQTLTARLTARKVVDVEGPYGLDHAAVNLGRLEETKSAGKVNYALRKVQPLLEVRVPFELSLWEVDNLARGASDVDLDPAIHAALDLADFEERAIYEGFDPGHIRGLSSAKTHPPLTLAGDSGAVVNATATAVQKLRSGGVSGPYALVLPNERHAALVADVSTYPPRKRIEAMLEGGPILSAGYDSARFGFLVSLRGGDVELCLGQDVTLGFDHSDAETVKLYLTESFTARVLGPEAVVILQSE